MMLNLEKLRFHLGATRGRSRADLEHIWRMMFAHRQFFGLPADSETGRNFTHAIYAAATFGYVNRMAITEALRGAVRETLGDSVEMPLLFDCSHVGIQQEEVGGESLWVHRHGANVALPPSKCASHPVFSQTGQPIPVPGSMGADSYIGVGVEGNLATYHSANHGAGRVLDKPEAGAKWSESAIEAEMASRHVRLYRGKTMNIAEQAPDSFKDIGQVIRVMKQLNIAAPVVRVEPLATMKG
jgi:tRNA-splicing ligase RtcB